MLSARRTPLFLIALLFLIQPVFSQQKTNYNALWKRVDSLQFRKSLPASALTEVNKIYTLAKKEKQEAEVIKALLYKIYIEEQIQENVEAKHIAALEGEIKTSTGPTRYILLSVLAGYYNNYFQANRWQLYGRTQTVGFNKDDIATWGIDDFHKKITTLYLSSLQDKTLLQQTKLEAYEPLILKGNTRHLRPTLYDLLAFNALEYFENDEREVTKPAFAYEIKEAAAFEPAADLIHHTFISKDSSSLQHKALLIYQQLLAFHINDKKPDALIDADIHRLQFVYKEAVMDEKENLYKISLQHLLSQYENYPAAAQAGYLLAAYYANKAYGYNPHTDTANRFDFVQAKKICENILKQKDSSEGKYNCFNLLQTIERKSFDLISEMVNLPNQPFRTLINYRNVPQLYFRVLTMTPDIEGRFNERYTNEYWNLLVKLPAISNWKQQLPATNDYQRHSVEIKVDALPAGSYILLASVNENFSTENLLAYEFFSVSSISYVNKGNAYFVVDRESGKPLPNASLQQWWELYESGSRSFKRTKGQNAQADKNGYAWLPKDKSKRYYDRFWLEIKYGKERLMLQNAQNMTYSSGNDDTPQPKIISRAYLFSDRSIYRPGQTVWFKGIVFASETGTKNSKVLANAKTKLILYNHNYEKVDSITVTTNEYGSYNGKFILPQGQLNGQFHITDETYGQTDLYFSVEEYKRPTFFVEYKKPEGTFKVNDSITLQASAKAYAGNNIGGAQVKYRVQRVARFIYPWLYKISNYPSGDDMEITHGTVTTGADGNFTITFKAIPDASVKKELEPIFDYKITADVTDIGGETRSAVTTVPVSYKALQLSIDVPVSAPIAVDSFKKISISTKNIAGVFEPALVKLTISRQQPPDHLVRARQWEAPDQFVMSKEEFTRYFPFDAYANETDNKTWPKQATALEKTDSSKENSGFDISNQSFTEGFYVIEATARDKYGAEVKDVQYIRLYDDRKNKLTDPRFLFTVQENDVVEPGQTSVIKIGSSASDVFLIQQVVKTTDGQPVSLSGSEGFSFFTLNNEIKTFSFTPTEADRGGYGIEMFFVKNNRLYTVNSVVNVPWTNKDLTIQYATFRDKTLPGSQEKWKLTIGGYKNEKVAAEVLASMYDLSLDEFRPNPWYMPYVWQTYWNSGEWSEAGNFTASRSQQKEIATESKSVDKQYEELIDARTVYSWSEARVPYVSIAGRRGEGRIAYALSKDVGKPSVIQVPDWSKDPDGSKGYTKDAVIVAGNQMPPQQPAKPQIELPPVQIRKNFNETAFFFPTLITDSSGNVTFEFTMPEALTKWKLQTLAHTKDLAFGYSSNTTVTQKPLMVQPNTPRFLREGDKLELSAKVVNLTDKELTGTVQLELFNAATNEPADGWFRNMYPMQYFTAEAGQSTAVKFSIDVPYQYNSALAYRFVAKAGDNSDGEEASMPVLTNSMLVTESMPLPMRGNAAKNFRFEKLLQSGNSETLQHHKLTVEFTTNPAWYAVQALPYLMEYPYECAEQTFNRYYANALATKIANASPKIKAIFEQWNTKDTSALLSNLQKNEELKSVLLEETPWVLEAKNEAQQKKNIALLFNMVKMSTALSSSLEKLRQMQSSNGGFVWFNGGPDDRYITQYIITGIGHLKKLGALTPAQQKDWQNIVTSAIKYLDQRIKEDYDGLIKNKALLKNNNLGYMQIQYLYMRSFFNEYAIPGASFTAVNYYRKQSQQFWVPQNRYMQGMIALSLFRTGDIQTANNIIKSLQQNAINNEEMGMYWKDNTGGYFWQQAPVETQSLLIEAFSEIKKDNKTTDDLKTWLLKQKQVQNWKTTKATADACYALLLQGTDWLSNTPTVEIKLGDKTISASPSSPSGGGQEGDGYFKQSIAGPFVKPAMGEISVKIANGSSNGASSWGAVYWQYFEHLDKITPAATPLKLSKKLFVETNTDKGPVLTPVNENDYLHVGDKIKVRIELRVDRDMEYVHMKDMRASCMEPVNVLSGYKWQGGLGYYETTKDASTNFFFNWLRKGTYVFEYPLFVTHTGNFSNGITSIQCMYAPEFSAHSEGVRVNVEENK